MMEPTCREVMEFLLAWVEGELGAAERAVFDRHLEDCRECADYVRGYLAAIAAGKAAHEPGGPLAAVPERLVQAVLQARRRRSD